jgi:ankyrin repeat protein
MQSSNTKFKADTAGLDKETVTKPDTVVSTTQTWAQNIPPRLHDTETDANRNKYDELMRIHWAAQLGQTEVVEGLLEGGAEVDVKDKDGLTGLYWAARFGHYETVEKLLRAGAEAITKD